MLNASDLATRYCDEALKLLSAVADFYDHKNIAGNGPHEALANCLVSTKRYKTALTWIDRGIKIKKHRKSFILQALAGKICKKQNASKMY